MKLPIINANDSQFGTETLKKYYADNMIPAEKKTYLTKLRHSVGPYMGIEASDGSTHYMLDAASQIATLGHGFNPAIFFGTSEFLESWTNDQTSSTVLEIKNSYAQFFARKLGLKKVHMALAHSGAEANEMALGHAYSRRIHPGANKVLAFEGSFHGRMMVTLSATWNKSKREPFEWKNYLAEYLKYPELEDGQIAKPFPGHWRETWDKASLKDFAAAREWNLDPILEKEVGILMNVREKLLSKKIFAILIEPMQCEGGECYSSDRFHTALLLMARTFKVPVIYDEVQTGFHLGREFFWHRQFELTGVKGEPLTSDYVVCAKKAQLGIVLSSFELHSLFKEEEFSVASFLRGYAHAISLDQAQARIIDLEKQVAPLLFSLGKKYPAFIKRMRLNGLAFAFDVADSATMNKFVGARFKYGLLYYPAGDQTLRFRLSTAFGPKDLAFLFEGLDAICRELFLNETPSVPTHAETDAADASEHYEWHELLIQNKSDQARGKKIDLEANFKKINALIKKAAGPLGLELIEINPTNFLSFRQAIIEMQKTVYEPARQTDIEKFEHSVLDQTSLCLGLVNDKKQLMGIAFAGPLKLYPLERGVRMDPYYEDPDCLYTLDLTIAPTLQKSGLGRALKYALSGMAGARGIKRIQGRNRDRLAQAMLNINLSLGATEQAYIKEDYPDFEPYRDVFYYSIKTAWEKPFAPMSSGITSPLSLEGLGPKAIHEQLPYMVNKVCLSNFVSEAFLAAIKDFLTVLPAGLRHGYTTSGQSECVDKLAKTIWVKSSPEIREKHVNKMLTFKGHHFGSGSMLSRSLSFDHDPYFEVTKLPHPTDKNAREVLKSLEAELSTKSYLAVWIEPVLQKSMERVPQDFLLQLRKLCTQHGVALIYNETGAQFFRYSPEHFMTSSMKDLAPDAGMIYFSGQAGMVFTAEKYFLEQPLMMISTWDGDEFHLLSYYRAFKNVMDNLAAFKETKKTFHQKLLTTLAPYELDVLDIEHGSGHFCGNIPQSLREMFIQRDGRYIVCPNFDAMKEFIK